jgi:hypothetical protein
VGYLRARLFAGPCGSGCFWGSTVGVCWAWAMVERRSGVGWFWVSLLDGAFFNDFSVLKL